MNAPVKRVVDGGGSHGKVALDEDTLLEIDPAAIFRTLRKHLGVISCITIGLTSIVVLMLYQFTPLYTGHAQVLLDRQKTQVVDMEAVMSGLPPDSATVDSEVEILRSRSLIRRVVESRNLVEDPEFNSALRESSPWRWLDPRVWTDLVLSRDADADSFVSGGMSSEREIEHAIDAVLSRTTIERYGATYIIGISFVSQDSQKAARIANAIAEAYLLDQLEAKFEATKQANEWLSGRLDDLRRQVSDAEKAVAIYRAQNGLEEAGGMTVTEQQLSELNAQLILARASLAEARAKYSRAQQLRSQAGRIESVADVLQSSTISSLRQKQAELARERANLSAKYGPRHPAIINVEAQQSDIANQINAEVRRIIDSIQNNVSVAETRVSALEQSLKQVKGDTSADNQALIQLRELEREASSSRAVYESFLNRFKETTEQQGLQTPDTRIIAEAVPPASPTYPRKMFIGSLTFFLSLLLGIGVALLLEYMDNGLQTARDVEQKLGLVTLVSMPKVPTEKGHDGKPVNALDYLIAKPLSAFSEALRSLRSALQLSNVDNPPKVILFTSALPSEGKTTTAASFARAAAASGLKVILLDCDLRHPSVHRTFNIARPDEGLVELLAERLDPATVIVKDTKSELDLLPVAMGTANPPDVLASSQMKLLLQRFRDEYDLVVLDSAPVLPVADSRVLARMVDEVVFVIRWNATPRDAALAAIKELRQYDATIAGAVLTVVDTAKQAKYGYGDSGYYYASYSKYYAN